MFGDVWKFFFCCSVWTGLEETDRVSVIRTSEALAVSTARPPTNMDQTVTEVSLSHLFLWHHTGRCDVRMMEAHLCETSPVCPQPVLVSTDNAITARTQTVVVNRTPVWWVSPVGSVNAGRRPAASRFSSVTPTQTATSARQPLGGFTCIHHTLNSETHFFTSTSNIQLLMENSQETCKWAKLVYQPAAPEAPKAPGWLCHQVFWFNQNLLLFSSKF